MGFDTLTDSDTECDICDTLPHVTMPPIARRLLFWAHSPSLAMTRDFPARTRHDVFVFLILFHLHLLMFYPVLHAQENFSLLILILIRLPMYDPLLQAQKKKEM